MNVFSFIGPYVHTSLLILLLLAGCDAGSDDLFEQEYVLEAYLVAGEPVEQVRLSRTAPINETYDFTALAVRGAEVQLALLDAPGGAVAETYRLREVAEEPGVYRPEEPRPEVRPLHAYRLDVTIPADGHRIAAATVVPDTFRIVNASTDAAVFQGAEQLELKVTRSRFPGREQSYFIFVTEALDPREEQLTPLAKAFFDQQDGDVTLEDLRVGGSPVLSEANYDVNPDETITIRYPWLAVAFFGPNRLQINVLDDNLYDYVRSQSVQQGGSTFAPGEIPNPIEHVVGARGVFGSYARVRYLLVVKRPEEADCAVIGNRVVCGEAPL